MPITELVFPLYKLDPQSLVGLKENEQQIFGCFAGVEGLLKLFRGPIMEDSGTTVDLKAIRSVLAIEWDDSSSFHNFFPQSEKFQNFVKIAKPFAAAPAIPELYEAEERSTQCLSSNVTQIIRVQSNDGTRETWKHLEELLEESVRDKLTFYHANGTEKDQDMFLGLIGWKNLQQYEQFGKDNRFLEQVKQLNIQREAQNIVVQLSPVDVVESKGEGY